MTKSEARAIYLSGTPIYLDFWKKTYSTFIGIFPNDWFKELYRIHGDRNRYMFFIENYKGYTITYNFENKKKAYVTYPFQLQPSCYFKDVFKAREFVDKMVIGGWE